MFLCRAIEDLLSLACNLSVHIIGDGMHGRPFLNRLKAIVHTKKNYKRGGLNNEIDTVREERIEHYITKKIE